MPNYILRNIDPEFWRKVKLTAVNEQMTIRQLVFRALQNYMRSAARRDPTLYK